MYYTNLRDQRNAIGYSQQDLSRYLGLQSRNAYALKERGERRFSVEEGIKLAYLFSTSVEQLFAGRVVIKRLPEMPRPNRSELQEV